MTFSRARSSGSLPLSRARPRSCRYRPAPAGPSTISPSTSAPSIGGRNTLFAFVPLARIPSSEMALDKGPVNGEWIRRGGVALVATLRATNPATSMWAWGSDQHVRFWSRRQLHETLVHRFDLELSQGERPSAPAHLAADTIDEFLDNLAAAEYFSPAVARLRGNGESILFAPQTPLTRGGSDSTRTGSMSAPARAQQRRACPVQLSRCHWSSTGASRWRIRTSTSKAGTTSSSSGSPTRPSSRPPGRRDRSKRGEGYAAEVDAQQPPDQTGARWPCPPDGDLYGRLTRLLVWGRLPDPLASHFGLSGTPDGFMGRSTAFAATWALAVLPSVRVTVNVLCSKRPSRAGGLVALGVLIGAVGVAASIGARARGRAGVE